MSESQRLSMPSLDTTLPAPRRRTRTGWERWQDGSWVTCAAPVFRKPDVPVTMRVCGYGHNVPYRDECRVCRARQERDYRGRRKELYARQRAA